MCAGNRIKIVAYYSLILIVINVLNFLIGIPAHISIMSSLMFIGFGLYEIIFDKEE